MQGHSVFNAYPVPIVAIIKKGTTYINENARREFDISRADYALCSYLHYRAADPRMKKPGWCCDPKDDIADFVGISRPGLYKMVDRMILKGLIEADAPTSFLRATVNFIDSHDAKPCKQSLQRGVNKVDTICKQSLHDDVNKVSPLKAECNVEGDECDGSVISSTADAAAHAELPQSKKSKTKKLASPAAPKPEGWTKQWATAFDEVDKEKCEANHIPYESFMWTVCAEQSFAHLRNLREKAIIPSLTEKRKREGKEGPISELELLISARAVFSLAWDYFQRIAAETGGTRHYTPQSVYKNFNTLKIAKQQEYAANQRNTSTGYVPTVFNRGVGNIDPYLGF